MLYRSDRDLGVTTRRLIVKTYWRPPTMRTTYFVSTYRLALTKNGDLRWRAVGRSPPMGAAALSAQYGRQIEIGEIAEGALNNVVVGHYEGKRGKLKLDADLPLGEQFWRTLGRTTGVDPVKLRLQR